MNREMVVHTVIPSQSSRCNRRLRDVFLELCQIQSKSSEPQQSASPVMESKINLKNARKEDAEAEAGPVHLSGLRYFVLLLLSQLLRRRRLLVMHPSVPLHPARPGSRPTLDKPPRATHNESRLPAPTQPAHNLKDVVDSFNLPFPRALRTSSVLTLLWQK